MVLNIDADTYSQRSSITPTYKNRFQQRHGTLQFKLANCHPIQDKAKAQFKHRVLLSNGRKDGEYGAQIDTDVFSRTFEPHRKQSSAI
jgi:hypothetical protein